MLHSMMAQYQAEGVTVAAIPFEDNSPCVELLESKMGILALLDDECNFPKGSDEDFLHKLMDRHRGHSHLKRGGSSSDPYLKEGAAGGKLAASSARVQSARECFVISHFAGEVEYSVAGFLDKNRDTINESLKAVLKAVQQQLLLVVLGERDPASIGAEGGGEEGEGGGRVVGGRRVGGAARAATGRWVTPAPRCSFARGFVDFLVCSEVVRVRSVCGGELDAG
jgi:myosin heavy chain 1/2/3/4/8/13/7B/15